jgi:hypothetical protein
MLVSMPVGFLDFQDLLERNILKPASRLTSLAQ